ncbi:uncharacterized protein JCM15063_002037 [Sporobolomyces koalae]|uniref:uncharacterized protein n=1 Tax=Sporobolomyces koalae TaxID=500713 RepID=UPI0031820F2E
MPDEERFRSYHPYDPYSINRISPSVAKHDPPRPLRHGAMPSAKAIADRMEIVHVVIPVPGGAPEIPQPGAQGHFRREQPGVIPIVHSEGLQPGLTPVNRTSHHASEQPGLIPAEDQTLSRQQHKQELFSIGDSVLQALAKSPADQTVKMKFELRTCLALLVHFQQTHDVHGPALYIAANFRVDGSLSSFGRAPPNWPLLEPTKDGDPRMENTTFADVAGKTVTLPWWGYATLQVFQRLELLHDEDSPQAAEQRLAQLLQLYFLAVLTPCLNPAPPPWYDRVELWERVRKSSKTRPRYLEAFDYFWEMEEDEVVKICSHVEAWVRNGIQDNISGGQIDDDDLPAGEIANRIHGAWKRFYNEIVRLCSFQLNLLVALTLPNSQILARSVYFFLDLFLLRLLSSFGLIVRVSTGALASARLGTRIASIPGTSPTCRNPTRGIPRA